MNKVLYFFILVFLIFGCASSKKAGKDYLAEAPAWVRQSPNTPGYYHGVGSATKALTQMGFREKARQNALSGLAGNISVKISSLYIGKAYGVARNFGVLEREDWQSDGSWIGIIKIPAGMQTDFYDKLNDVTKGNVETRILK